MSTYAKARIPTPLYNTAYFPHHKSSIEKDTQGLLKSVEMIALPNTKFTVYKEIAPNVSEISTIDYPSSMSLYVDSRFLEPAFEETPEREKSLPSTEFIINFMRSSLGVRYFWGGNWAQGIKEMPTFYPQLKAPEDQNDVMCRGVDCSGLLYQATNGFTPRNTSQLFTYGRELQVNKDSLEAVQQIVRPLDMMVWRGHVIFVLDPDHFIESVAGRGVIISDFAERYSHFLKKLRDESKSFSLRRWHPHFLT